ncbi:MAG: lysophospholipid acyltransferase family protein [Lachnospiraceae bacterium]
MKIIFDNDATVVDYRRFIDKHAIPYFKKKYNMNVVYEDKLELEDIFDCKNVLIRRGYSEEGSDKQVKSILDKFWINPRYILYSVPWMFFPKAAKTLRILKKQGHHVEIHTAKMKASESNFIGRITRVLMYLQYWGNGIFIPCRNFIFYKNDEMKAVGVINSSPEIVFEDKLQIIKSLSEKGLKSICVLGKHNKSIHEDSNVRILSSFKYSEVEEVISKLLGKRKWKLCCDFAKSDIFYRKILKLRHIIKWVFRPIILNKGRLKKIDNRGIIYASNHRSTLDPIIITTVVNEPIRYAALKRFFDAEDSIFNNSKNPILCKITSRLFQKLRYFPIERICDNESANNTKSLKDMAEYANIKGKIGIFPEGTTLKNKENDFNKFENSFIKLAVSTNSMIQPISIFWFEHKGKKKCIINFGELINTEHKSISEIEDIFLECQINLLREDRDTAQNMAL